MGIRHIHHHIDTLGKLNKLVYIICIIVVCMRAHESQTYASAFLYTVSTK
jgi:hypothetical protein